MSKNWVIAPFYSGWEDEFNKVWEFDREHGIISIGFDRLGDFSNHSLEKLKELVSPSEAHMLYNFYHTIEEGDRIVARFGRNCMMGVGTVTRKAYYDPNKLADLFESYEVKPYAHHLDVEWDQEWTVADEWCDFGRQVFGMQTIHSISSERLEELLYEAAELEYEEEYEEQDDSSFQELPQATTGQQFAFVLEKYLEEFIVSNFAQLFGNELAIESDEEGNPIGQQYDTFEAGKIDLLCRDLKTDDYVVIELKRGRMADKVVGQPLRYMGWVKENLCQDGQNVRGMVICKDSDTKLKYALSAVSNVAIKYFRVDFELGDEPFGDA